jgi:DNA-binding beta-propeller fold protein YncE
MGKALFLWLLSCCTLTAQWYTPPPHPTALPSHPFFIRNTWFIGGVGPWDMMTMDASAQRLYIAHGPVVQVVDVQTGTLAGEIRGLSGARAIALDDTGGYGYISDGPAARVVVFDRRSLQTIAAIPTEPDPRSLVYEPRSGLVFVVQAAPPGQTPAPQPGGRARAHSPSGPEADAASFITVIDPQADSVLGTILVSGHLGYAQTDGAGEVYVGYSNRGAILRFSAGAVAAEMRNRQMEATHAPATATAAGKEPARQAGERKPILLDWTGGPGAKSDAGGGFSDIALGSGCGVPHGFAVDGHNGRIFAACGNMTLEVLNTATGQVVSSLPIGSGVDDIGYDPVHSYIFAADGAQDGNLTVIRRDFATDSYAIVQNLPTRERAFVMAVDAENGEVYLVTDIEGADLTHAGGIGALRMKAINGSFQVIQIGN